MYIHRHELLPNLLYLDINLCSLFIVFDLPLMLSPSDLQLFNIDADGWWIRTVRAFNVDFDLCCFLKWFYRSDCRNHNEFVLALLPNDNTMSVELFPSSASSALTWAPQAASANQWFSLYITLLQTKLTIVVTVRLIVTDVLASRWRARQDASLIFDHWRIFVVVWIVALAVRFGIAGNNDYAPRWRKRYRCRGDCWPKTWHGALVCWCVGGCWDLLPDWADDFLSLPSVPLQLIFEIRLHLKVRID